MAARNRKKTDVVDIADYKSGSYEDHVQFKAFVPSLVNHGWTWSDTRINTLLEQATKALAELDAFSRIVPDVDLFISLHVAKEANDSSRIEGTQTNLDEAFRPIVDIEPKRRDDWQEVQNYVAAMSEAIVELESLPLSTRLLRNAHRTLMRGVRGQHKGPGEWRRSQNWIGGTRIEDAVFIPPPHTKVPRLMSDLEKFWHNDSINVPHLLRVAISHYQFETIHPFLDGNGRVGRLMITLYLIANGLLLKPSLYISSYFEKNRAAYYDAFMVVRSTNDLGHWIRFFLVAIRDTAELGATTFKSILHLRTDIERRILKLGRRAGRARNALELLYRQPVVSVGEMADHLGVSHQTANRLAGDFVGLGVLIETTGFRRNRRFAFGEYLQLFESQ